MKRCLICLMITLALPAALPAQEPAAQPVARLRAAVAAYERLVQELAPGSLPVDAPDYDLVTENLQALGERLENLSRLALKLEGSPEPERAPLLTDLQLYEADLLQLRRQSLPLRVWSRRYRDGEKKPAWGLAVSHFQASLPQAVETFDADVPEALELSMAPGEEKLVQIIVVPLTKDLRRVRARLEGLRGPEGRLKERVTLRPVDYERAAEADEAHPWWALAADGFAPDVPRNSSHAFILHLNVPPDLPTGGYAGKAKFDAAGAGALVLEVQVRVVAPQ